MDDSEKIGNIETLLERKNILFHQALKQVKEWKSQKTSLIGGFECEKNDLLLFRFAPKKIAEVENEYFQKELYDTYPSIYVGFLNNKEQQILFVQDKKKAFVKTDFVVKIIAGSVNQLLADKNLEIHIQSIFDKQEFWSIVEDPDKQIQNIKFRLITPNMANILGGLSEDLKNLAKSTNTTETSLEIAAGANANLHINKDNEEIKGIVDYASQGGGDILIKIQGFRKRIKTSGCIKSVEIDEAELKGNAKDLSEKILSKIAGIDNEQ
ncbi:hypothetical protein [Helicobacter cetorum]|uniref:hypothetical protein n=1 Tax=Helicobacter cetorum TaxID=138563 RepID=UPI0013156344|nr:hypothetical protein [Helicobacter cetorum]